MCYLIAKKRGIPGCYAYKTEHGIGLVEFKKKLNIDAKKAKIQLVTLSRPSAYGEYAPYKFVDSESDFVSAFKSMLTNE